jgi:hypothetical protein
MHPELNTSMGSGMYPEPNTHYKKFWDSMQIFRYFILIQYVLFYV